MENKKTPISKIQGIDLTSRLNAILIQAYHRRSRQLPANISEITETLKGDLLKAFPDVPIEVVDNAIVTDTLHNPDSQLCVAFFFQAVKKAWFVPKTNLHPYDGPEEDLNYWQQRVKFLERAGMAGSNQHSHACEMVEHYRHGDTEQDTISLLDTCAEYLAEGKAVYFNPRREFAYLVLRGQLYLDSHEAFIQAAKDSLNKDRVRDHRNTLSEWKGGDFDDLTARCQDLCVRQWLLSCHQAGLKPSDILRDKMDERSYQQLRKTV